MARVKGFAPWKPQKRSLGLLEDIEAVLDEYQEYLPLTVRQIFYRLVGEHGYEKSENFYERVSDMCTRARRSGRILFSAVRDDGVSRQGGETLLFCYDDPQDYYQHHKKLINTYGRSWHEDQPARVIVLCEAAGMVPLLSRAAEPYRVEVVSSSGFDSLTVKYDIYQDAELRWDRDLQSTLLLHLGDHDPSGVALHESMAADLSAFAEDRTRPDIIEMRRVALTPEQIIQEGIETDPEGVKPSDSRSRSFIERGLEPAAQLEAIPPGMLLEWTREAIEGALDMDILRDSQQQESLEIQEVQEKLDEVNIYLRDAFGLDL